MLERHLRVLHHVPDQRQIAISERRSLQSQIVESSEASIRIRPRLQAVPDQTQILDLLLGPEVCEATICEKLTQGV